MSILRSLADLCLCFMLMLYREMWDGPRPGPDGALELTGVDEVYLLCVSKLIVKNLHVPGVIISRYLCVVHVD